VRARSRTSVGWYIYIGQFYDDATSLDCLNARYYDAPHGQFLSEDPVFLSVGDPRKVQQLTQQQQNPLLSDPQLMHSYGYARNNPVMNKDATGLIPSTGYEYFFRGLEGVSNLQLLLRPMSLVALL
jgi:RHS repeat-associated protein